MTDNRRPVARGYTAVVAMLAVVAFGIAGCSTAPITDPSQSSAAPSGFLREGPQTAVIEGPVVEPIAVDPTPVLPVTVPSLGHGEVTVTDVSRIIPIDRGGTIANIVYSLGLGPNVVAKSRAAGIPEADNLPVITDTGHAVNTEAVLAQNPTVVLVDESTTPPGTIDQLIAAGQTVVVLTSERNIATTPTLIQDVADALGVPEEGEQLATRTENQIKAAEELIPDTARGAKMAFLYLRGPRLQLLSGPGSGADDLIATLGGVDAGTAAGLKSAFTTVNTEAMINADPDVILVMTQGADSVGGIDKVVELPGLAQTDAGRNKRVVQMDEAEVLTFGPNTGRVLAALAQAIYR
ncbi:heme/hemin ABC transporter substrate-binding protein [Williamsia sp.]|uniref:heme/hemin ABC transporter substrate-binding protein n=1 Tax=Williamsia sp. TaxID=1872085 RepID=UPI002F92D4B2